MKKVLTILTLLVTLCGTSTAFAALDSYKLLEPLPCVEDANGSTAGQDCQNGFMTKVNLAGYLGYLFRLIIALAGAIAIFRITWGGFKYMTTDAVTGKKEGKAEVQQAIYGLLMILASYLILRTIDPRLVAINTELPPIERNKNINFDVAFEEMYAGVVSAQRVEELRAARVEYTNLSQQAEALLAESRQYDAQSDLAIRLKEQALQKQRQAAMIYAENVVTSKYEKLENRLSTIVQTTPGATYLEISQNSFTEFNTLMADLITTGNKTAKELEDLQDPAGALKIRNRIDGYVIKERSQFNFLNKFSTLRKNYLKDSKEVTYVKEGDKYIIELQTSLTTAPTLIKDPEILELYKAQINNQISQIKAQIDPLRWRVN